MRSNRLAAMAALVAGAVLALPVTAGAAPSAVGPASAVPLPDGTISPAAARAASQGYLVPDQAAYADEKRRAASAAPASDPFAVDETRAPATARGWSGIFDTTSAPSDTTSAVGSTRFIELINRKFAVYNKTTNAPIRTGTLEQLAGFSGNAFDPQIMWDGQTNRFYYTMDVIISDVDHRLAIGYSKTASPNGGIADFCHYQIHYGSDFPDYPKLGDTADFWMIGSNVFGSAGPFVRSDVAWLSKPPAGTTCVDPSTFKFGVLSDLRDPTAAQAFTPVPATQVDPSSTGYIIARTLTLPSTRLSLHTVSRNADGSANIQATGRAVAVPSYAIPPDAKQRTGFANSDKELDTLDARPTQAVLAFDPARAITALWTQHTVAGGAGAEVRWYEIRPFTAGVPASGKATSAAYSAFNGAISPDRVVSGTTKRFGQSMVLGFSTSGTGSFPAIRQLSKVGTAPQSAHALVKASTGNYVGFDCAGADNACRWGDYAAATPDPTPPSGATRGRVWSTNQFASGVNSTTQANWRSWNWVTTP